jgi:methionyl-tRNA synthetase
MNILFRITGKKILKRTGGIPAPTSKEHIDSKLLGELNKLSDEMQTDYSQYDFISAFSKLKQILYLGNVYLSET